MSKGLSRGKLIVIAIAVLATVFGAGLLSTFADTGDSTTSEGVIDKVADPASDWGRHMQEPDDTSELSRVKTDKTVRTVGFEKIDRDTGDVIGEEDIHDNFTVTFSALSSGGKISGMSTTPADVVLILDFSSSMRTNEASSGQSRAAAMVHAANDAIKVLMEANPNNRVAVVTYGTTASTMIPLQHISSVTDGNYLTINHEEKVDATVSVTVTPNAAIDGAKAINIVGATNTEAGVYYGMNTLATATPTITIGGKTTYRVPGVILMSDGIASVMNDATNWWELSTDDDTMGERVENVNFWGNGYMAMLEAAYMKNKVSANYGDNDCLLYTVGVGVDNDMGRLILNPSEELDEDWSSGTNVPSLMRARFASFTNGTKVSVPYARNSSHTGYLNYTVNIPTGDAATFKPGSLKYNDSYTEATNGEEVVDAFVKAIEDIMDKAEAPTDAQEGHEEDTGYIVFTDTVGELMEVKEFKSILWTNHSPSHEEGEGVEYPVTKDESKSTATKDVYVCDQTVYSSWLYNYEEVNLSDVIIEVDHSGSQDVVTIKIPPALLPMVDYEVTKDRNGNVTSVTRNEKTRPIKVNYIVGPKDGVIDQIRGEKDVEDDDLKAAIDAYVADESHLVTLEDGTRGVALYTNAWQGSDETMVPVAEFGIGQTNSYYTFTRQTQLYLDKNCTEEATSYETGTTYYYKHDVYKAGKTGEEADDVVISSITPAANDTEVVEGKLYMKEGTPKDLPSVTEKDPNATETRDYQLSSHWQNGTLVHQHQGNNGRLVIQRPGELQVDKTVTIAEGLRDSNVVLNTDAMKDKEFTFQLTLTKSATDSTELAGAYDYVIKSPGAEDKTGAIKSGDIIALKDDETLLIKGLPADTKYTLSEPHADVPAGYSLIGSRTTYTENGESTTVDGAGDDGTVIGYIRSAETSTAEFTNEYSISDPADLDQEPKVRKIFDVDDSRGWTATDSFTFEAVPYDNNPDPSVTIDPETLTVEDEHIVTPGEYEAEHAFNGVSLTKPGTYHFRIREKNDDPITGVTYSRAVWVYTVKVTDNGDGTMSAESSMVRSLDDDGQPSDQEAADEYAEFTNTYDVQEVSVSGIGVKVYTDTTGGKPLTKDMFQFELRPDHDQYTEAECDDVPMPVATIGTGYDRKVTVGNTVPSGDFDFGSITFSSDDLGGVDEKTFYYVVQEEDPDTPVPGMTYDDSRHKLQVKVTKEDGALKAEVIFTTEESIARREVVIKNTYEPDPVTTDDSGETGIGFTKILEGRGSLLGEEFNFTLTPANADTRVAVAEGTVQMGDQSGGSWPTSKTVVISGLSDGDEKDGYFEDVKFTRVGTYLFTISETRGSNSAITYDDHALIAEVKVVDGGEGRLVIDEVNYTGDTDFTNSYSVQPVSYGNTGALQIEKMVTGRDMKAGEFTFEIKADDENAVEKSGSDPITIKNASGASDGVERGTQAMMDLRFTQEDVGKTFTYKVTEKDDGQDGITYDTAEKTVTFNVTDDGKGNLRVETSCEGETVTSISGSTKALEIHFANEYEAEAKVYKTHQFTKTIQGRTWQTDDEFTFKIAGSAGAPMPGSTSVTVDQDDKIDDHTAAFSFGDITFTKPGDYIYTITEEGAGQTENGLTRDPEAHVISIAVRDDGEGHLVVTSSAVDDDLDFVNRYEATSQADDFTGQGIKIKKTLTGSNMTSGQFLFTVKPIDTDESTAQETATRFNLSTIDTLIGSKPAADGVQVAMDAIEGIVFTQADDGNVYGFEIREVQPDNAPTGMTYDQTVYRVYITPEDDGKGNVTVGVDVRTVVDEEETEADEVTFSNVYAATGQAEFKAIKDLQGRAWNKKDEFSFTITPVKVEDDEFADFTDSEEDQDLLARYPTSTAATSTAKIDKDQQVSSTQYFALPSWTFNITQANLDAASRSGDYYYRITEVNAGQTIDGVKYSTEEFYAHIRAVDDGQGNIDTILTYEITPGRVKGATPVFTNTYASDATGIQVTKTWTGDDADKSHRKDAVMHLYRVEEDGTETQVKVEPITLATGSDHEETMDSTWTDLPIYDDPDSDGNQSKIKYRIHEEPVAGYKTTYSSQEITLTEGETAQVTVTNQWDDGTDARLSVVKHWKDADDQDGKRPEKVTVQLTKSVDGADPVDVSGKTLELKEGNNWAGNFEDLPATENGKAIAYSVTETDTPDGYKSSVQVSGDTAVVTNTHTPEEYGDGGKDDPTDGEGIAATKVWSGDKNDALGLRTTVKLTLVGTATDGTVLQFDTKEIKTGDTQTVHWKDVPIYHNGKKITYTVEEDPVYGYTTGVTGDVASGFTVTNTLAQQPASVTVTKKWEDGDNQDGKRPGSVTFQLMKKVGSDNPQKAGDAVKVNVGSDGSASYTWNDLTTVDGNDPVLYAVEEADVPEGYTASVLSVKPGEFQVVNRHSVSSYGDGSKDDPTGGKGIQVKKIWSDDDDKAGDRPGHITVRLMNGEKEVTSRTVTAGEDGSWTTQITGVPVYEDSKKIDYTVKEDGIDQYTSIVAGNAASGFTVTNTFNATKTLRATKVWKDEKGATIDTAPEAVTLRLIKRVGDYGDKEVDSQTIKKGATGDELTVSWKDLPSVERGLAVTYHVEEVDLDGYDAEYSDGKEEGNTLSFTITNTKVAPRPQPDPDEMVLVAFVDGLDNAGDQVVQYLRMKRSQAEDLASIKPEDPSHAGYAFQQWDQNEKSVEGGETLFAYVARFTETAGATKVVSYVDPLVSGKNAVLTSQKATDESDVKAPADPSHKDYKFTGWTRSEDAAGNVIYTATYDYNGDCSNGDSDDDHKKSNTNSGNAGSGGDSDNSSSKTSKATSGQKTDAGSLVKAVRKAVKTGDKAGWLPWIFLLLCAGTVLFDTLRKKIPKP